MIKILKYTCFDMLRSWWSYAYFLFYFVTSATLLNFSADASRAITSLMNIIITLCPLISTLLVVMYYYSSREFIELLLAQPLKRSSLLKGQFIGLAGSLSLSFTFGLLIPFLIFGLLSSENIINLSTLIGIGVLLTFIFSALGYLVALHHENKIKGFGTAIFIWLFMAVIYDGLFLFTLVLFNDYPTDKIALGLSFLNPIDLARIIMMLKLDISALMGYTGALFNSFFGSNTGLIISVAASIIWVIFPTHLFLRKAARKDF
ncbi:ABC transporter permease [Fulvivirgaceae bacterium BMA12]|uniref:ABC transporter permease n=1 Tax=Agaribacillus aureus TaxID=3051825 RepID=A0ABT8KYV0_9BACT|nr:ABC transporter permease [Fulvivirgaceae bacterium BMA12]